MPLDLGIVVMVMLLLAGGSRGAFLRNVPQTLSQPDGRTIACYASGDEYFIWLHDADGNLIIKETRTGYYVYASQGIGHLMPTTLIAGVDAPNPHLVKQGAPEISEAFYQELKNPYERPHSVALDDSADWFKFSPSQGSVNNLVVLIRFADSPQFDCTGAYLDSVFNVRHAPIPDYFWSVSVADWLDTYSRGQCQMSTTFYPKPENARLLAYQDSHPRGYYQPATVDPVGYTTFDELAKREHALFKSAVDAIQGLVPADLNIDQNKDGLVDYITFLAHGFPGGGSPNGPGSILWPHMWRLYNEKAYIHGKRVWIYQVNLLHTETFQRLNNIAQIHEMLHCMGAPDYYRGSYFSQPYWPVINDVMAGSGICLGVCAYTKYRYLRWIEEVPVITASGDYYLKPVNADDPTVWKILSPQSQNEYFLLEYRNKSWPIESDISGQGLYVYRINTTCDGLGNFEGPPDELYQYRVNGTTDQDGLNRTGGFSSATGLTAINDQTNPASFLSDGSPGGLDIRNVGFPGDSISFHVTIAGTGVAAHASGAPAHFQLRQNYPNPFNGATVIAYALPRPERVNLDIFNLRGERVKRVVSGFQEAGSHQVSIQAEDMTSGIYYYTLMAGRDVATRKLLVVK
jgi:M6 family metalloprotease-like protein